MGHSNQSLKASAGAVGRLALRGFLDAGGTLDLTPDRKPVVSALILALDRAEVTFACLRTLAARLSRTPLEVVVVDNGSTDATAELLARVQGITVVRNRENVGFPKGVNQAAQAATGDYLLLLNNDAEVFGRSIDVAADYLHTHSDVGAVGGKVVLLDGRLQEAGCVVWRDGWVDQHARGQSPDDPAVGFERDVDYCSAAFLMTPRRAFTDLGGLDERYSPGYFEDVDYAVRLWKSGRRVVFLPDVVVLHHEGATSAVVTDPMGLFRQHMAVFAARHADWLRHQPARDPTALPNTLPARRAADATVKLFALADASTRIDELVRLVKRAEAAEGFLTLGLIGAPPDLARLRSELPTTEFAMAADTTALRAFLVDRAATFDLGLVLGTTDAEPLRTAGLRVLRWDGIRAGPHPVE